MNNQLAQKAQYYLNESHRLAEELKTEQEYSELLENILVDLYNNEQLDENIKKKLGAALLAAGLAGAGAGALKEPITNAAGAIKDKIVHQANEMGKFNFIAGAAAPVAAGLIGVGAVNAAVRDDEKRRK